MANISYADGQSLVPQSVADSIIQDVSQTSIAMRLFNIQPMSSKTLRTPVLTGLIDSAHVAEGGTKTTSKATFSYQDMTAEEIAVIVPVAENLLADSSFDLWGVIKQYIISDFARKIDAATLFGTNAPASFPNSLVEGAVASGNVVHVGTNAANAGGVAQDVLATVRKVYGDGYQVTGFAAADLFNFDLLSARDANGNPLLGANASVDTLYGRPIAYQGQSVFAPGDDKPVLIAGDFKKATLGVRQDITFTMSKDATVNGVNLFETDQIAIRAVMRYGYSVATPINAGNSGNASRFPFAVLNSPEAG